MRISQLKINNFRGIAFCNLLLSGHTVLIGDNNTGKSSVLEAIDLVLGPERLSRYAPIDEHDFYGGRYLDSEDNPIIIEIEVVIVDLSDEQKRHFRPHLEFWNEQLACLIEGPPIEAVDEPDVKDALRICFIGRYDPEDDDFKAETFFCAPLRDDGERSGFSSADKRRCGFLYLRWLRTGSRALSLERGSLLDIILRVRELRPKMWEQVLAQLRDLTVAEDPALGLSEILTGVQSAIREFVPADWGADPKLRVSDLTRKHLRRTLTVFMATGALNDGVPHAAPFQHQGTGTINTLVLALLSMIADAKETVIFAMEEPEIAIPPYTQKRIVDSVRRKSSQALFTSHSPFVLEEFDPSEIMVLRRDNTGRLTGQPIAFPAHIKPKAYSSEYRQRFAEALLARRVLIAEGTTEADAYPAAARRLAELDGTSYSTLEALGIAVFNAGTDNQIANYGQFFRGLGKETFAVYDRQDDQAANAAIVAAIDHPFEAATKGLEDLILRETGEGGLRRYSAELIASGLWPPHLAAKRPNAATAAAELRTVIGEVLRRGKGTGTAGDLLAQCLLGEIPSSIKATVGQIKAIVEPPPPASAVAADNAI
jgi:putative ATP-dependent endonuclease of the OLD family